jgi:predicted DNA-binding transcriptional regulator YafY
MVAPKMIVKNSPSATPLAYPDKGPTTPGNHSRREPAPRLAPHGEPMRYERAETIFRIALDMQGSATGLSLDDIQKKYSDAPLSRRTAERLRDAVERLFPQLDQVNPGEFPKRWRLPGGSTAALANISAGELADLATAVSLLRHGNMHAQADSIERAISKIRALLKRPVIARIEPDLEALTEAEGLAMQPGPRPKINPEIVAALRQAILSSNKVRLHYLYRGSGKHGFGTVHPYGFLYGLRHYLVAWSESEQARDFRSFALSNIERVELLDKTFTRKRGFSLQAYAERSFGVFQENPFDVVWRFSPKAAADARQFLFHPTQAFEDQADGSLIVRFRAGGAREMCWHLFTWGADVEVLKPRRLRSLLNATMKSVQARCLEPAPLPRNVELR